MADPALCRQLIEPDKCEGWVWLSFNDLKGFESEDLFLPIQHLLKQSPNFEHLLEVKA